MQTQLAEFIRYTPEGAEAEEIINKCVHCGFCMATCPTYQLTGDELDGPRGRIYLIKQLLEGEAVTSITQGHLDSCLTCRACETTCPSGVHYSRLADIGRHVVDQQVERPLPDRALRWAVRELVARPALFGAAMQAGRITRSALPAALKEKVPVARDAGLWPKARHARKMLALAGCVQPSMEPGINTAAARVLDALGVSLVTAAGAGCCGAVRFHLDDHDGARGNARSNIDAWWPLIESQQVEALVMTASGCGVQVKDYGHLLQHDPAYAAKAARISELTLDISQVVAAEASALLDLLQTRQHEEITVAWHSPCTLQHGLKITGTVENLLKAANYRLTPVQDAHLCCGSAGTYSIFQPEMSKTLRQNKLHALHQGGGAMIASANIGCISHLQGGTSTPVRHWIELLDTRLAN
ncbi:MAG: glycolate oxidase subunit GlcF [Burkholderiaceae bacterium]|nr:glycolate oxidase subunit GlcF [Burkholderiaceae bacterium]